MVTRLEFCLGQLLPPFPGGLWMASQHHKGIQRLLVLLAEGLVYCSLPWSSTEPLGASQLYWPQATPRHPYTGAKALGLIYSQQLNGLCRHLHLHLLVCPCFYISLSACLFFFSLTGGQTFILSLYFRISQSPLRLETLPASLVKVTLFAKSGGALEIECVALVSD